MTNTFIYALIDPITHFPRYVGQSSVGLKRPKQHLKPCVFNKVKGHVYKWIKSLASMGLQPQIVILEECSVDDLNENEMFYISYLKSLGCMLTNHTDGGEGMRGFFHSKETRDKLSKLRQGKKLGPHSSEHRAKIAASNRGKIISEEARKKMSKSHLGKKRKPFSAEHKRKLSIALAHAREVKLKRPKATAEHEPVIM